MVLTNDRDSDRGMDDERDRDRRRRDRDRQSRQSNDRSNNDRDRSPRGKKKSVRVFISNIPYEYRWQELKDLFREHVGEVSFVELFVDENEKPRGCGIIEFSTSSLAKEAVDKMHRFDLKGRKLVVKEDNDVERDKYGRILPRNQRGGGGGGNSDNNRNRDNDSRNSNWNELPSLVSGSNSGSSNKWGNTYGLSTQFLESLNITPPLLPKCFVANLDYKVDEKKLREVFRLAGRVIHAEISVDKEGKSRGFGTVEYEHPVEAVQAISMLHNQRLYDRAISVRIDRVDKGDGLPPKLPEGLKGLGMGLGANGAPLIDVARNLPNQTSTQQQQQQPVSPAVAALPSVTNLATAALVNNLLGGNSGGTTDLSSLANAVNPLAALTSAHHTANNPLASSLLGSAAAGGGLSSMLGSSLGRNTTSDFDSLSAALSGAGGTGLGSSLTDRGLSDRNRSSLNSGNSAGTNSNSTSDTIVIKNLPSGTTWQQLRDKCRDAGDVKFAEMRGKDTGVVQFASQWDAQRAISMLDGIRVDGRIMDVRYY
uniref:Myelin expression factor 2 n=1 Tax=Lygus hesperus TaxID=30085 RepID=A0A0A9ZEP9_LYGHE